MTQPFTDPLLAELALEEPSGLQQTLRYRLAEWRDGQAIVEMELDRQHMNRRQVAHGGVIAALIDTACGFCGGYSEMPGQQPGVATLTLTTSFVAPVSRGLLRAVGRRRGGGSRVFFAAGEVFDDEGRLVAFGEGTYRVSKATVADVTNRVTPL